MTLLAIAEWTPWVCLWLLLGCSALGWVLTFIESEREHAKRRAAFLRTYEAFRRVGRR